MINNKDQFWLRLSVLHLLIVAALGTLMRYKIGFEFPFFEQKFLQHGHSHFAFSAWITQTLFVLMIRFIRTASEDKLSTHYRALLIVHTICSWGMLISFVVQGYGLFSISFSTLSILLSFYFAYLFLKDLKNFAALHPSSPWFRAGLLFLILSSAGTFVLAYMMASHQISQKLYLASVYFYLHFQYNGWFFFAAGGLLIARLHATNPLLIPDKTAFRLLAWSCVPAYLLSTLWLNLPLWIFIPVVLATLAQTLGWMKFLRNLLANFRSEALQLSARSRLIFLLIALSLSIKFLLQLGSCIPSVSQLAFGFRPIVIAYLHLVLLAVFTLFLLNFMHGFLQSTHSKLNITALWMFTGGVFANELLLGIQGIASFSYTLIPYVNEGLFAVAVLMLLAAILLFVSLLRTRFSGQ